MSTPPSRRPPREASHGRARPSAPDLSAAGLPGRDDIAVSVHALRAVAARLEELVGHRAG